MSRHPGSSARVPPMLSPSVSSSGTPTNGENVTSCRRADEDASHRLGEDPVQYSTPHSATGSEPTPFEEWDLQNTIHEDSRTWDDNIPSDATAGGFPQECDSVMFHTRDFLGSIDDPGSLYPDGPLLVDDMMLDLEAIFDPAWVGEPADINEKHQKLVSDRTEAFRKSLWLWVPEKDQNAFSDASGLPLGDNDTEASISSSHRTPLEALHFQGKLSDQARDSIFQLFLRTAGSRLSVASFPNVNSLDALIKIGIAKRTETDAWIHPYTVYSRPTRPELLTALVAAGCVCSCLPSINQTGVLLLEIVRVGLSNLFESDNSVLRDLAYLQASMIWLDIGIFCGYKRKMQIAESYLQPLCTALRRAGAFDRSFYQTIAPAPDRQEGKMLEIVWHQWIQQESFKRLVYHLYEHDVQVAIGMNRPALTTYAEMTAPLPAPRDLWMAATATEWRKLWITKYHDTQWTRASLRGLIVDPSLLNRLGHGVDMDVAHSSLLHGLASQLIEFQRQSLGSQNRAVSTLWMQARQDDLYMTVQSVRGWVINPPPASTLLADFALMNLHVSMDSIQRLAGKLGEEEAREEQTRLESWFRSIDSRTAVWHAGQVLRAASDFLPYRLRGFDCLAIYHASLTLWVFALFHYGHGHHCDNHSPQPVCLNGEESQGTKAFISGNTGNPGLALRGVEDETVFHSLKIPRHALNVACQVLQDNFPGNPDLPPLVNNLLNLMRELGNLP